MRNLSAITRQTHIDKSWTRVTSYKFAAHECFVPMTAVEIPDAALSLPLAFVKQEDHFILAAILSLTPGTNLFVSPDGQWMGQYVPSEFRGYPFRLARGGPKNDLLLCVDDDSGLVNADKTAGEPIFSGIHSQVGKPFVFQQFYLPSDPHPGCIVHPLGFEYRQWIESAGNRMDIKTKFVYRRNYIGSR